MPAEQKQYRNRSQKKHTPTSNGAMTVSELARIANVSLHAVRYYSRIGLLNPKRDRNNGYKLYGIGDIGYLKFIHKAQSLGYTLAEIIEIFEAVSRKKSPCPRVREIIQARIVENRQKLEALLEMQSHMERALRKWEDLPDGVPDGHTVCHLIESAGEN